MSKKINLEEVLAKHVTLCENCHLVSEIKSAMLDACKETLELAAENAEVRINNDSDDQFAFRDQDGDWCEINVNKQSILDTINQIE